MALQLAHQHFQMFYNPAQAATAQALLSTYQLTAQARIALVGLIIPENGYQVGDTVTISGASLGGANGANDLDLTITASLLQVIASANHQPLVQEAARYIRWLQVVLAFTRFRTLQHLEKIMR